MSNAAVLQRRLAAFRQSRGDDAHELRPSPARRSTELAERLAAAIDADVIAGDLGTIVRRDVGAVPLPIDRSGLASLPGQPPASLPLICLDTETTGLATAAGTMAFLVGLGWWERSLAGQPEAERAFLMGRQGLSREWIQSSLSRP